MRTRQLCFAVRKQVRPVNAHRCTGCSLLVFPPLAPQVFGVQQGVQSEAFWREVALLQRCVHPRIVPVYGVAVQVRCPACLV